MVMLSGILTLRGNLPRWKKYNTLTYGERLLFLKLPSLKFRRTREDMIQVFQIINGLDDLNWRDFFIKAVSNVTRHSEHKLFVRYNRTNKRKNTFSTYLCGMDSAKLLNRQIQLVFKKID